MHRFLISLLIFLIVVPFALSLGCRQVSPNVDLRQDSYLQQLSIIPVNEDTLNRVCIQDYDYLLEKIKAYPPYVDTRIDDLQSYSEFVEYSLSLPVPYDEYKYFIFTHDNDFSGFGQYYDETEWEQALGFTRKNVEQSIVAGSARHPLTNYQAVRVDVAPNKIDQAVKTGPMNDILKIESCDGIEYYGWGEDNQVDLSRTSKVRPLGIGGRMAYMDGFLFWTTWTGGIKEMMDSYNNEVDSLADLDNYRLLAQGLAELDVYEAFFTSQSQSKSSVMEWQQNYFDGLKDNPDPSFSDQKQRFDEAIADSLLLEPYPALATGAGIDSQGSYIAIVLLNTDHETAKKNASLLDQRLQNTVEVWRGFPWVDKISQMEIKSDRQFTLAKLYGEIVGYWINPDMFDDSGPYEPVLVSR